MIDGHPALDDLWPIPIILINATLALGGVVEAVVPIVLAPIALIPELFTPDVPGGGPTPPNPEAAPKGNPHPPYPDYIIHCTPNPYKTGECLDGAAAVKPPSARSCNPHEGNSFVSGTRILMADGSTKVIEDVKIGDEVTATDPRTGRTGAKPVTALIAGDGVKYIIKITMDVDGPRGTATDKVIATDNHPFWVPTLREWVDAGQLRPGMWLQTSAGTYVQIAATEARTAVQSVYNLTVDNLHTYHVLAGDQAILVHNSTDPFDEIDPNEVRFTQDSVSRLFKSGHSVEETRDALRNGTLSPHDLDPIRLVERDGKRYTLDNRRLVAFQQAGLDSVPYRMATPAEIRREWRKKFTTETDGVGIQVRGDEWHGPCG
ncbi:polymorphic toxin-type HINT domain-containing protein [Nonomuraea sp. 3N208]|uniref:polymorphic toxin-type HINT domain-containing protein n=1 Tax=Nonomuraea sp. 3N208 TaxID=3457421 RepID=UPI003FCFA73D